MASALSQRQTVAPLMEATIPLSTASRAMSALLSREKGMSLSKGSWQAKALTSIMILGGKTARSPAPWAILEAVKAFFKKPFTPLADDFSGHIEFLTDLFVLQSIGGK